MKPQSLRRGRAAWRAVAPSVTLAFWSAVVAIAAVGALIAYHASRTLLGLAP